MGASPPYLGRPWSDHQHFVWSLLTSNRRVAHPNVVQCNTPSPGKETQLASKVLLHTVVLDVLHRHPRGPTWKSAAAARGLISRVVTGPHPMCLEQYRPAGQSRSGGTPHAQHRAADRATRLAVLDHPRTARQRRLRLFRGLLQPPPPALHPWLPQPPADYEAAGCRWTRHRDRRMNGPHPTRTVRGDGGTPDRHTALLTDRSASPASAAEPAQVGPANADTVNAGGRRRTGTGESTRIGARRAH